MTTFKREYKVRSRSFSFRGIMTFFLFVTLSIIIIIIELLNHSTSEFKYNSLRSRCKTTDTSYISSTNNILLDPNLEMPWPRVSWLLSFPNSGTSFTMKLVSRASGRSVASNYGAECEIDSATGTNRPLDKNLDGPFLVHFSGRPAPDKYILTKTHCGSRCTGCSPLHYIETKESFLSMCSRGSLIHGEVNATTGWRIPHKSTKIETNYNPNIAQRAIHLIRNPFDNIVSNFHLERNEKKKQGREDWLRRYPNNAIGFKQYCQELDVKHSLEESESRFLPPSIRQLFSRVPCHAAFFLYIQWHNLALQVENQLQLPTLWIYYEDYGDDFNHTSQKIFDFLQFSPTDNIPLFTKGKQYQDYFTDRERNASVVLMKRLADPSTFQLLRRYLD